jgi:flagellar biosynthesis protein FlhA
MLGLMRRRAAEDLKKKSKVEESKKEQEAQGPKPGSTEEVTGLLAIDTLELEVGFELVQIVEGGDLVERIRSIRRQFALDYGFIVPPIHIRDNVRIKSTEYRFMLRGGMIGSGTLKPYHLLAMDPGNVASPVSGQPTKEPAFGLDALWIVESDKERAQMSGYTVVDLSTVITTHIKELVRAHMHELLGRQEVQHLVDNLAKVAPKVVEELVPSVMSLGSVQQVLAHLLREQVSIRDLRSILEVLADWAPSIKSPERLAEFVRRKFARAITSKFVTPDGVLPLVSLSPSVERMMNDALQQTDEGSFLALEPGNAQILINKLARAAEKFGELGQTPVLLAPGHLRPAVFHFVDRFAPGYAVLSHHEVAPNTKVQSLGVLSIGEGLGS